MTSTDLFPLIKVEEQVISGPKRGTTRLKRKAHFKNTQLESEDLFVYFWETAEKGISIL